MLRSRCLASLLILACSVFADPVSITGYNVTNAAASGFGGWAHVYTGTIAPAADPAAPFAKDYTGGTGTMADGVIGNSESNTQLFRNGGFGFGGANKPTITLFFDGIYSIDMIEIYGGPTANYLPGGFNGATITFGGATQAFASTPFGPTGPQGNPVNDRITLTGSSLAGKLGSSLVLSNVVSGSDFSITEIKLYGTQVPEPGIIGTLGAAGALVLALRRSRPGRRGR